MSNPLRDTFFSLEFIRTPRFLYYMISTNFTMTMYLNNGA